MYSGGRRFADLELKNSLIRNLIPPVYRKKLFEGLRYKLEMTANLDIAEKLVTVNGKLVAL